ncbi:hypothetical protein [Bacillus cereus]|uniref:hypothetical protein n=1 Tax=Bacillus cereus TaxID=1396 RepID=UPI00187961F5|nr:hypothetical protein [Bacillus cereus]MBE7099469.1 hypothetical protein [Bacillus cereus]
MGRARLEAAIKYNDEDFVGYIDELLTSGRLDEGTAVHGIAKKISKDGCLDLSENQKNTFIDYGLLKYNYLAACERCGEPIPWSEMLFALEENSYCGYCDHISNKDD